MAAHTVGGSGIETVIAEETAGRIGGEDLAIKEHRHRICVFGAELHIVGYHHDGNTPFF